MRVIVDKSEIKFSKNNYVALGSFDGLHLGHLSLINKVKEVAKENEGNSMVYTFKNHPRSVIKKDNPPQLLMDNKSKEEVLEKLGVDFLYFEEFTKDFMKQTPEDFVRFLVEDLGVCGIVVGFNYRFGFKNLGDVNLLKELREKYNYNLYVMEPYEFDDIVVSSSRIREELKSGNVELVNEMLSRPISMRGIVTHGKKLGRTLGYPTANLKINPEILLPKLGVYYTNVKWNGEIYKGITSVGMNPTVNGKNITVETFILDFNEMIYDDEIVILFLKRIRDELKFDSLDELVNELKSDEEFAKREKLYVE
ncbi:MAG: bifunctional riboflavin kinase/FAD synthetase [Clostridium sp.]